MAVPADLADRTRRWSFSSSVNDRGFRVDTARVEYASISPTTFLAVSDTLNAAASTDSFSIVVTVDGVPVELFRGIVTSWELEQKFGQHEIETVGILEAQDERGMLLRELAPLDLTFRGVEISGQSPGDLGGTRTGHTTFAEAVAALGARVGLTITSEVDYTLTHPVVLAGMSLGTGISYLLDPLQQAQGLRADFVRNGSLYEVRQRTIPLGAPDFILPITIAKVKSYRKTLPKPPEVPVADEDAPTGPDPCPISFTEDFSTPDASVSITVNYFGCFMTEKRTAITIPPITGSTTTTRESFSYDMEGHQIEHHSITDVDGEVQAETRTRNVHNPSSGRNLGQVTAHLRPSRDGTMAVREIDAVAYGTTETGTHKTAHVIGINPRTGSVRPISVRTEHSHGDTSVDPERINMGNFSREEAPLDPTAQVGRFFCEATVSIPLDMRIQAGMIVEFTDVLVATTRYYVVGVDASWDAARAMHEMTLKLEAWVT